MLSAVLGDVTNLKPPGRRQDHADRDSASTAAIDPQSYWPTRPTIATTGSFHPNNRNIDRRNDANTAEFARTGQGLSCPAEDCEEYEE